VEPAAVEIITEKVAKKHLIMPISLDRGSLHVAMADPLSYEAFEDVSFASGYKMKPYVATKSNILWAIEQHYHIGQSIDAIVKNYSSYKAVEVVGDGPETQRDVEDLKKKSESAPIVQMVNLILANAIDHEASDIHVEATKEKVTIRNRIDGMLRKSMELPKWVQGALTSRIKIMAKMDIAEKRQPQDGRIGVKINDRFLDLRISTLPTKHGEKVVLRILDPENAYRSVEQLGLSGQNYEAFLKLIDLPQGIILVTGPTGSGKTTTLYAAIEKRECEEINIITIEEPIEYELEGINQVAVNEKVGMTFASALRSILRQDPDVIMVGEMRDLETATIAMQASLTGQLVFSTVHTNNSVATVTRLTNLGIAPYLIASSIIGIISQRLVRVICPACKTEDNPEEDNLLKIGLSLKQAKDMKFYRGEGCGKCGKTGYKGRTGIYEMLIFSRRIKELISTKANESVVRQVAIAQGMKTLAQAGMEKILSGETTVDEVIRVIQTDEDFGSLCPECNFILASEFVACPQCGRRIVESCPSCHKLQDQAWTYCPYCREKRDHQPKLERRKAATR
jgi:type IV pilus assembly protein PilB